MNKAQLLNFPVSGKCFLCKIISCSKAGLKSCLIYKLMLGLKDLTILLSVDFWSNFNILKSEYLGYSPSKI